ncbi:uncharacterized protein BXZ73DRAFT_92563 [Epithele typhae]|uniref:uncharacterized protein n=1 Tax=Epithele typhae TaxID=378194 RepID=UPI0020079B48|nr:uncharacterized protein BXZ73DRAFT_92563 [Epithele typhae]KAH9915780.1 hypothetical protein BXZ73DRAFT_92563 [Epithele typhae]
MGMTLENSSQNFLGSSTLTFTRFVRIALLTVSAVLFTLLPVSWTPGIGLINIVPFSPPSLSTSSEPGAQWKDDIWPLREQTPWDISTDFPFPRLLEYDVTEGTWLRLDVNTKTGDVVFDMLGDIYCLPASAYSKAALSSDEFTRAVPILAGVPHDSDPHFSPDGTRMVFRSDAGLGIENIWVTAWKGCKAMDVRPEQATGELQNALRVKKYEEGLLASGVAETEERKRHRLLREGRLHAQRVTNETYRWVSDARFHPDGDKVVGTKWHTSSRSLPAGEAWEYLVPSAHKSNPVKKGDGKFLVGRTLPLGWDVEDYEHQQVGPNQFVWLGEDALVYSKNVRDVDGTWEYSKDVHQGIDAIYSKNLTTGVTTQLVSAVPGGATRPEISPSGRTLAFVRRVRDKEALVLKDLVTGTIRNIWHGLTYDLSVISTPMGTYPSFAFTPKEDAIIIWAAGQIYHVPLSKNKDGEHVAAGEPRAIPFKAHIEKRLAETRTSKTDIKSVETADSQRVYAFTELRSDANGEKVIFQASGATYVQRIGEHSAQQVPVLSPNSPYFSPSFVPGADDLVLHGRWSDVNFTTFELANLTSGTAYALTGLPLGRYYSPILCGCAGSKRRIAFIKTSGDHLTGSVVALAGEGLYLGEVTLPSDGSKSVAIENVHFVPSEIDTDDTYHLQLSFVNKNKKLLVQSSQRSFTIDLKDGFKHTTLATGLMSTELAVPPPSSSKITGVAIVDFFHIYYAPSVKADDAVWSKPASATKGLMRVSLDGGHSITWSGDGSKLFWFLGPWLHHVDVTKLSACSHFAKKDQINLGIECTKQFAEYQEVVVEYPSDIKRLKAEATAHAAAKYGEAGVANADFFVFSNATLVTMDTGKLTADILHDAVLVTHGGVIEAIAGVHDFVIPYGATVVDVQGGYIVPGFIDVHAHWAGYGTTYPARSWEMETFLAYGVTTLHNPSSNNALGFNERFRMERGQMVGPRIYHTGDVIYGAGAPDIHQDIVSIEEAKSALVRIKVEGGPSSYSYKNYNLPSRASRQRLLLAARELEMLCVPEGGMNWDWDITYIIDGMTTVEHSIPIPVLHDDMLTLYALSGTGSTPTHIVNYGGVMGEQYVWANEDIPNNPRLRQLGRHDLLERVSESTARPLDSYQVFNTSVSIAKMVAKGHRTHIGAHGEPPLGVNYHSEMMFAKAGGLTNYEVLRAASLDAAITLGLNDAIGSLTPGKLADFVVYPAGVDVLDGDISSTRDIRFVVRGGRVWEAATMTEVWPVAGRREPMPPYNAD